LPPKERYTATASQSSKEEEEDYREDSGGSGVDVTALEALCLLLVKVLRVLCGTIAQLAPWAMIAGFAVCSEQSVQQV
jgi:hypothetical protein